MQLSICHKLHSLGYPNYDNSNDVMNLNFVILFAKYNIHNSMLPFVCFCFCFVFLILAIARACLVSEFTEFTVV